jgi:hypothetical protein
LSTKPGSPGLWLITAATDRRPACCGIAGKFATSKASRRLFREGDSVRIDGRLSKLERNPALKSRLSLYERFLQAVDESARRLTGRPRKELDSEALDLVLDDVEQSFLDRLSITDLASIRAEVESKLPAEDVERVNREVMEKLAGVSA